MLGWIAIGLFLVLLGICWYNRKEIKKFWKQNKKKIAGIAVAGSVVGTSALIIPEGYRPNTATMITNSNGKYWSATGANLQLAIDDLNGTGGVVTLPVCNITLTDNIDIGKDVWLRGQGENTILFLGDGANGSMIINYGYISSNQDAYQGMQPTECPNITISDLTLNGNADGQDVWFNSGNYDALQHAIKLFWVNNSVIRNVNFKDITVDGVNWKCSNNIKVIDCDFENLGMTYDTYAFNKSAIPEVTVRGTYFFYCSNLTFSRNTVKSVWCSAVAIEPGNTGPGKRALPMQNFMISDNIIDDCWTGIWLEGWGEELNASVRHGVITNNVISNATRMGSYTTTNIGLMNGIGCVRYTYDIVISNNVINKAGNMTAGYESYGKGIFSVGRNITITGNSVHNIYGQGIYAGPDSVVSSNVITNCTDYGVYIKIPSSIPYTGCPVVIGNYISDVVGGIRTESPASVWRKNIRGGTISNNVIKNCDTSAAVYGIRNRFWNITLSGNSIEGGYEGMYLDASYCKVSYNTISYTNHHGVSLYDGYLSLTNNSFIGNVVSNCDNDGFNLYSDVMHCQFIGNTVYECVNGFEDDVAGNPDYNIYLGNIVMDCSGDDYDINGNNNKPATEAAFEDVNIGDAAWWE